MLQPITSGCRFAEFTKLVTKKSKGYPQRSRSNADMCPIAQNRGSRANMISSVRLS